MTDNNHNCRAVSLVLLRHGESIWNKDNKFCGWVDADLADTGHQEAKTAGRILREKGFTFDVAFCSVLKRSVKSLNIVLDELDLHWIPVFKHWRLNERHYGALQGKNKAETAALFGEEQVKIWRRAYDVRPPPLEDSDPGWQGEDARYKFIDKRLIPRHECLKDAEQRILPYWHDVIFPKIKSGSRVLICVHGTSVRALLKYLNKVPEEEIIDLNIPTGIPLVFESDKDLSPVRHYYLADEAKVQAAIQKVADQGKARN
ncbi:uncharacterized protein LOC106155287 [Lingula anatina]|uniref:Phosphoglycerate mutase n=1 Tax=Lingula anatina TaxID=7574 RepID=A0A1S3HKQ1_LINAN|nr:uncharacterized protein LOC106155287 [Lingula anatina]XP_013385500.1 uncharacterized protein LOC106155287 [Lingula anatina]XP_013385509.1 uncharacterized protein LOC106155287 [Lingula anatina]XP_013385517.1 uncharacterized protein LOC106155287 [Lingula anatina]XP_013385528.1 uncharacterized protein LOC106155287 [Lingula anatina]XP_013385538.1 uncharacterized protein LOC106155287 [Lingula anatina]XP_013385546.1 uncharacterized protein LOC106155287 [Lingula anatina]XP_013385554.1 uncharacte|eukprot:XP_013385490.1 uncharacterized protein LOC106155287 [Lingula anatina]